MTKTTLQIILACIFSINSFSRNSPELWIIPNKNTLSSLFISGISVKGNDTIFSERIDYYNSNFQINNIPKGKYQIEFITNFQDTINQSIEITKNKKYKILFPEINYYVKLNRNKESINKICCLDSGTIQIYIFSIYGSQVYTEQKLNIWDYKALFFTTNHGMLKKFYKERYLAAEEIDISVLNELRKFLNLSLQDERVCPGNPSVNQERSIAIVMKDREYISFEFCPKTDNEFEELIYKLEKYLIIYKEK